ncbi:MAG: peptidyl-prolyl cis-trans isomerase [Bacteroidales bacterium]|nr:peptidyl-prolyl cis-trans isomerase [Bacteroidales bacterium]MCF8333245.1 peptidyl-prolyl cis-trans isomerase [Bacteroidales bacterium]
MRTHSFKQLLLGFLVVSFISAIGQNPNDERVVMTIEDEAITANEFLNVYNKNNNLDSKQPLDEYLDLFINYKLKVKEAKNLGYDTIQKLQKELEGYRDQLAEPYLMDEEVNKELMREAYDRMRYDIRASHIMLKVSETAPPEDTLKAYNKIMDLRRQAVNGTPFSKLATKYSEDPSARERKVQGRTVRGNKGDLGYFSVFDMVYPFETAAYNLEEGEISQPVRTKYGYHLIKVTNKHKALGRVKAAHILKMYKNAQSKEDSLEAKNKIQEIYQKLKDGADFAKLAKQESDDRSTSRKGGNLPWFGSNRMIPEFVEAAYKLKETGDFSKPFRTSYGWHIMMLKERKGIGNFEEEKEKIKKKLSKSGRDKKSKKAFVKKIRDEYNAQSFMPAVKELEKVISNKVFSGKWDADTAKQMKKPVFKIGDKVYTQYDFAEYIEENQSRKKAQDLGMYLELKFKKFRDDKSIAYEDSQLEKKYPEFKSLMKEYRNGILLFELTNDKVWEKAVKDTTGLKKYYKKHKKKYMWDERADATIAILLNPEVEKDVKKMLKQGKRKASIDSILNSDSARNISVQDGLYEKDANPYIRKAKWEKGLSKKLNHEKKPFFVKIHKFVPPEPKTLDEARGIVTADYQNYLEKQWINKLRKKYDYEVNQDVLKSLNP